MTSRLGKPDTPADVSIRQRLSKTGTRHFIMIAGAGSGKTTSLIKALNYLAQDVGTSLRKRGQQIACITYTDGAVGEISGDVGHDPLFHVSPHVIIVQQDQRDDNTVAMFFGLLLLMGLISFSVAFFLLNIHLFEYWPLWLGSLGVTSYLIVTSDRAENIIMGGMTAMSASVGPLVINNNMSYPLINEQLANGLLALSIFVWGFICYRYDNIWQITKTWMPAIMVLSLGSIFVFFYYG